jgi:hypothetical protein
MQCLYNLIEWPIIGLALHTIGERISIHFLNASICQGTLAEHIGIINSVITRSAALYEILALGKSLSTLQAMRKMAGMKEDVPYLP